MPSQTEEQQAQEFLKRAEIRTMKKDLSVLRERDSLKERDKIAKIKTLEELQQEQQTAVRAQELAKDAERKQKLSQVLLKNETEERKAEKDLKNYATEQERQQIFLFESQRLQLSKEVQKIDGEKDPAIKLQKNQLFLEIQAWQKKLAEIASQEKKLEDEQKVVSQASEQSPIPAEKKSLEQRRAELDSQIQEIEKKRWAVEKQIQDINDKENTLDKSSEVLAGEKNALREKILGIDKSLREIYSVILEREEDKKRGNESEQKRQQEILQKSRAAKNEQVQRQQWSHSLGAAPASLKEKLARSFEAEEEQRKKFLQDIETATNEKK